MTSDEIQDEIIENIFFGDRDDWTYKKIQDLSNMAGCVVEVFPPDAKDLKSVEWFTVQEDLMGSNFYTFKRKSKEQKE